MNEAEYLNLNNPFPEPFEMEITDALDLHAFSPKDVKSVVETYLQEARKKNFRTVRIIHGKGIGVQREIVRNVLAETDFVESFKNAPEFSGNWGATIVKFKD
jgi:dsDNA-specific endonuclease/ATPase MutS2